VLIAETFLGRLLYKDECVHHVDGDSLNNSLCNLCVVTKVEHGQCHTGLQKIVAELHKTSVVSFANGIYHLKGETNEKVA
jgi:hypothetical protein